MASLIAVVMLLAFLMGLGPVTPGHLSKKCNYDPWGQPANVAKVSQDKCGRDPWAETLNKSGASQKKDQATVWVEEVH
jgi:hypothetical protein